MKFIVFLLLVFVLFPTNIVAQKMIKVKRLLLIDSQQGEPYKTIRESMINELEKNGYLEGTSLLTEYHFLGNHEGKAQNIWNLLVKAQRKHFDAVFVNGTIAVIAMKKLAFNDYNYNFVFAAVTDPVGVGVIDKFNAPPKSNFTGVCYPVSVKERFHFIKKVIPNLKTIGFIYADMPQSISYKKWVDELFKSDSELKDIKVEYRSVPLIKSEGGHKRMAMMALRHVKALENKVQVFVSPNDQMGVQKPFAEMVSKNSLKPLIGLGRKDVIEKWGATASMFPDLVAAGKQAGAMVLKIFKGTNIKNIYPERPRSGIAIDLSKTGQYGMTISNDMIKKAGKNVIK